MTATAHSAAPGSAPPASGRWGLVKAAHFYAAEFKWPVYPWRPEGGPLTGHAAKDATRAVEQIDRWWRKWPRAMISIPTGAASGVFVVDLEHPSKGHGDGLAAWAELTARHGGAPPTLSARSPGGGRHIFFRYVEGVRNVGVGKLAPGVEIKGEGGSITLAPSRRADGRAYEWENPDAEIADAPQWLVDLIFEHRGRTYDPGDAPSLTDELEVLMAKDEGAGVSDDPGDILPPTSAAKVEAALSVIDPDTGRREWVAIGCALYKELGDEAGFALWDTWSSAGRKYDGRDMRAQWSSIVAGDGYAYSIGTVFHHADEADPTWRENVPQDDAREPEPDAEHEGEAKSEGGTKNPAPGPKGSVGLTIVRASDVESRRVDWLWKPRVARGKLTIVAGMPDVNKSTLSLDLAARVTVGADLPCGEGRAPLGSVIILSAEDEVADTIRPRLEVAGANLERVHIITAVNPTKSHSVRAFDLTQDIERLERAFLEISDVALLVIDPVSAYMGKPGKLDSHRNTDVRATLAPLQEMAARHSVAVIGIDHLNKSGGTQAMMRVLGSIAFVGAARAVHIVARDPESDDRRLFLPAKNNISRVRTGLAFRVVEKFAPAPVFDTYPTIEWEAEPVHVTADQAVAAATRGAEAPPTEAMRFLQAMLSGEPKPAREVYEAAEAHGLSRDQLKRARVRLGVVAQKVGAKDGGWVLSIPM